MEIVKLIVYDQKYFMFDSSRDIKETVMDFQITTKSLFFATIFSKLGKLLRNFVLHVFGRPQGRVKLTGITK